MRKGKLKFLLSVLAMVTVPMALTGCFATNHIDLDNNDYSKVEVDTSGVVNYYPVNEESQVLVESNQTDQNIGTNEDVIVSTNSEETSVEIQTIDEADIVYSDADLDGEITIRDVTLILQYAEGWNVLESDDEKIRADVYLDGKIDKKDSDLILEYIASVVNELGIIPCDDSLGV